MFSMSENTVVSTVEVKEEPVDELYGNSVSAEKSLNTVFSVEEAEVCSSM